MGQSVASSQLNVSPTEIVSINWKSILAWPWSAFMAITQAFTSSIFNFRKPLVSNISTTLDVDEISARLAIENRARADGGNEQPRSTEKVMAGAQSEIVNYFRDLQQRALRRAAILDDKVRGLREEIDVLEVVGSLRDVPPRCEDHLLRLNEEIQSQLNFLGERGIQQQQHYATFRENNQLDRVAEYPRSSIIYHALMAALIGAGAIALGNLSASGVGGNALIPASWAVSISLVGVLVPFVLAAVVFRFANHVRPLRRFAGWLGGGIAIAFVGALSFLFAYFMSALSANPRVSVSAVIDSIFASPSAVGTDAVTWAGFGIVLLAGLIAFLIGYKSDDSYPGYGAVQRAFYRARNEYELMTRRMRKRINAIVDEARADVTRFARQSKARIRQYSRLVDGSLSIPASLNGYNVALEDACNTLLDRYRAINRDARQTEVPLSFSEHIYFKSEQEPTFPSSGNEESRLEELHPSIAELDGEVAQARQKLKELNWLAISALEETAEGGDTPRKELSLTDADDEAR